MDFLETQMTAYSQLSGWYDEFATLYRNRLWHQLADKIIEFVKNPECDCGTNFIDLYEQFVSQFAARINQIKLVIIARHAVQQYCANDLQQATAVLEKLLEQKERLGEEATLMCELEIASLKLKKGEQLLVRTALEDAKSKLDKMEGVEPVVNASYYRVASEYHKTYGPADAYYTAALQYLVYTPVQDISAAEKQTLAVDIALAALVGKNVFNFGEVVAQPVLESLKDTPQHWLYDLLHAFQQGDIDAYNSIVSSNRASFDSQPALTACEEHLKQKITLLCVMELVAKRPADERTISFQDVAESTRIPVDEVEWILMRAMSLKLIEGKIDQIDQTVNVTYVKPRVLDKEQVARLRERFDEWGRKVRETEFFVEGHTEEMFK